MNDDERKEWIVRIERRRDGRLYFYGHDGNCNARRSSSMRLEEDVAYQLAHSIATQHPDFTARAMRFDSPANKVRSDHKGLK